MHPIRIPAYTLHLSAALLCALLSGCADMQSSTAIPQTARNCGELNGMVIPASSIGLPTSGAVIASFARALRGRNVETAVRKSRGPISRQRVVSYGRSGWVGAFQSLPSSTVRST